MAVQKLALLFLPLLLMLFAIVQRLEKIRTDLGAIRRLLELKEELGRFKW